MSLERSPICELGTSNHKLAYSIQEAVRASGLSRSAIYVALKCGKLVARKAGTRTIIETGELRRFLESLPKLGT